jgi:hypothetical protein
MVCARRQARRKMQLPFFEQLHRKRWFHLLDSPLFWHLCRHSLPIENSAQPATRQPRDRQANRIPFLDSRYRDKTRKTAAEFFHALP